MSEDCKVTYAGLAIEMEGGVSVVCPTYNSAHFITTTLQSVIDQTTRPLELIVVDDGSTDQCCALVEEALARCPFQTRLLRIPHRGPGAARNAGIRAAKGRWIAFIDSDDLWFPEKLATIAAVSSRQPHVNFLCHNEEHRLTNGRLVLIDFAGLFVPGEPIGYQLFRRNIFAPTAVVCARELLFSAGLFDEDIQSAQDYEMWLRMSANLRAHILPNILACYVQRPGNINSGEASVHLRNNLRILHRHWRIGGPRRYAYAILRVILEYGTRKFTRRSGVVKNSPASHEGMRLAAPSDRSRHLSLPRRVFSASAVTLRWTSQLTKLASGRASGRLRVLLFHHIPPAEAGGFAMQLRWLAREWRFVDPATFTAILRGDERTTSDCLLLTFDDGYRSNFTVAQEILRPMGIKALFFIPSDFIGLPDRQSEREFIANRIFGKRMDPIDVPESLRAMSASELATLLEEGHTLGSHTRTHARLSQISSPRLLDEELSDSAARLERMLGVKIEHLAFPFGDIDSIGPRALVRAARFYPMIYSGLRGDNCPSTPLAAIRRDSFQPADTVRYLDAVLRGGVDFYYARSRRRLDRMATIAAESRNR